MSLERNRKAIPTFSIESGMFSGRKIRIYRGVGVGKGEYDFIKVWKE